MVEQFRGDARTLREVIYCGDGAVPAGMRGYEALLAAADPCLTRAPRRGLPASSTPAARPAFPRA
jgi:hypothetical protein